MDMHPIQQTNNGRSKRKRKRGRERKKRLAGERVNMLLHLLHPHHHNPNNSRKKRELIEGDLIGILLMLINRFLHLLMLPLRFWLGLLGRNKAEKNRRGRGRGKKREKEKERDGQDENENVRGSGSGRDKSLLNEIGRNKHGENGKSW
jgi:hypothetical protein